MDVGRRGRGNALLLAHCASFDPNAECARQRLEHALGPELARRLVRALTARSTTGLRAWTVFAA
jgi:hypothetical protein